MIGGKISVGDSRSQLPALLTAKELEPREESEVALDVLLVLLREDSRVEDEVHHHPIDLERGRLEKVIA